MSWRRILLILSIALLCISAINAVFYSFHGRDEGAIQTVEATAAILGAEDAKTAKEAAELKAANDAAVSTVTNSEKNRAASDESARKTAANEAARKAAEEAQRQDETDSVRKAAEKERRRLEEVKAANYAAEKRQAEAGAIGWKTEEEARIKAEAVAKIGFKPLGL